MIEQAKSYADALRSGTPVFLSFTRTQLADTIDALVLEVERLTKQNNTIAEAYELEAAECSRYAAEVERLTKAQADTKADVEPPRFPTMLRKMWSGREVQEWINENWGKQ